MARFSQGKILVGDRKDENNKTTMKLREGEEWKRSIRDLDQNVSVSCTGLKCREKGSDAVTDKHMKWILSRYNSRKGCTEGDTEAGWYEGRLEEMIARCSEE